MGYAAIQTVRRAFDLATGYGPNMTEAQWLRRIIFLETVAGKTIPTGPIPVFNNARTKEQPCLFQDQFHLCTLHALSLSVISAASYPPYAAAAERSLPIFCQQYIAILPGLGLGPPDPPPLDLQLDLSVTPLLWLSSLDGYAFPLQPVPLVQVCVPHARQWATRLA